jgi:hypothetical protein
VSQTVPTEPAISIEPPSDHHFDVFTALHDEIKGGGPYREIRSRVIVSSAEYPHTTHAAEVACTLAVAVHGGMATTCMLRI